MDFIHLVGGASVMAMVSNEWSPELLLLKVSA